MHLDRTEFGCSITSRNMPKILVAHSPCDWNTVCELSHRVDVTILLGGTDGPGCDAKTLAEIAMPVVWVPGSGQCINSGMNLAEGGFRTLVRDKFELDSVVLVGAPLVGQGIAGESRGGKGRDGGASGAGENMSVDASVVDFALDAAWFGDVENRWPEDDATLCIAITAGPDEPITEADVGNGIDEVLRRIGINLRREMKLTEDAARSRVLARRTREAMARYVTVHITPETISLPQMPMLPFKIRGERLLGARLPILEHPCEGVRLFALSDLLYTTGLRFPGKAVSDVAHLRQDVLAWCHVVLFAVREIARRGLRAAIEALPLAALSSDEHIALGVLVEGISENESQQLERDLGGVIRASSFYPHVRIDVVPVQSLEEACGEVRTLDRNAIEMIHAALVDDGRLLPSNSGLTSINGDESSEAEEPATITQQEVTHSVRLERAERTGAAWCANRFSLAPHSSEPDGGLVDVETVI